MKAVFPCFPYPILYSRPFCCFLIFVFWGFTLSGQSVIIQGKVTDATSLEKIAGVSIRTFGQNFAASDNMGHYALRLKKGMHTIMFIAEGYADTAVEVFADSFITTCNISLVKKENLMNEIVVGASRYARPMMQQTGTVNSMGIREIRAKNIQDAAQAVEQLSGIVVIDGQANVRGGSGYAFGSGSRLMLVVDGMPLLTSDRNDVKWNLVPMENVERLELAKGASSVQYGSSALNGVLNIQTGFARKERETTVSAYTGAYPGSIPAFRQKAGDKTPYTSGCYVLHRRRAGKNDFVFDLLGQNNQSWLQGDFAKRLRPHFKFRHRSSDRLNYGVNVNGLLQHTSQFFLWMNDSADAFQPLSGPATLVILKELYVSVQPYLNFTDRNGFAHAAHLQYYHTNHINPGFWTPSTNLFSADYYVQKDIKTWKLGAGGMGNAFFYRDDGIGGRKQGNSGALFVQFEKKFKNLRFEGGGRYEIFRLDSLVVSSRPVGRFAVNYMPSPTWSLRSYFAQGFRFPSPAERLVTYNLGDIYVYPNSSLLPEIGWSVELGTRKKFSLSPFSAYVDGALFLQGFKNMMEFVFGQWGDPSAPISGLGFRSVNVNDARIAGLELESGVQGKFRGCRIASDIGYTYTYPVDLNGDTSLRNTRRFIQEFGRGFETPDSAFTSGLLRYRNRHLLKFDLDVAHKRFSAGASVRHYSRMDKIDIYFSWFIPGIKRYRDMHNQGDWVLDTRFSYQTTKGRFSLLCNNVFNSFYTIRIGRPDAPRSITVQYLVDF